MVKFMKKIWDKNIKILLLIIVVVIIVSSATYAATTYLYESNTIGYDNTSSGLLANNVQAALDELYGRSTDYSEIIELISIISELTADNSGFHNSVFRGKDVTSYYTDGSLYTRISDGSFDDLYVGDYIVQNDTIWRIAGFDIYYGKGDDTSPGHLLTHHAVIVPDSNLTTAQMNTSDTTAGGYVGSKMYTTILPSVLTNYITPVFGSHVLEYRNLLTNAVNTTRYNRWGTNTGASSNSDYYSRKLDLMNENQVTGSIEWSSSGYDTGTDNVQFPLFRLKPEFITKTGSWYWLRNVVGSADFGDILNTGNSWMGRSSLSTGGVRPYFYID